MPEPQKIPSFPIQPDQQGDTVGCARKIADLDSLMLTSRAQADGALAIVVETPITERPDILS